MPNLSFPEESFMKKPKQKNGRPFFGMKRYTLYGSSALEQCISFISSMSGALLNAQRSRVFSCA